MNATPSFYIIAYDLHPPGQNYKQVEEKINQLEETCKILNTTWIVKTNLTTKEIKKHLLGAYDANDKIFIARIDLPLSAWHLDPEDSRWIKAQINAI